MMFERAPAYLTGKGRVMTADSDRRTVASAHIRVDNMMGELREHIGRCSSESRAQNARLARLEKILIGTAGATIALLLMLVLR
jgi:hypothetical protein